LALENPASKAQIAQHKLVRQSVTLENDLNEFVSRGILNYNKRLDSYNFKVQLFHLWLKGRGLSDIIAQINDLDAALAERKQEEQYRVLPSEIIELPNKWGSYRGRVISEDLIRNWLDQFETVHEQRLMVTLLQNLKYYSDGFLRQKMSEIHSLIKRGLVQKGDSLKRSEILVSYIDGAGKSGAHLARLYADEAKIYVANVVEQGKLKDILSNNPNIQTVLFLDDIVATGSQASANLAQVHSGIAELLADKRIKMVFVSLAG